MPVRLASASVTSRLSGQRGRAIVSAKTHHMIVDSPITLGGPNEEINPIDLLLSALATHCMFLCERIAHEMNRALHSIAVTVTGKFDPRGVRGEPVPPHFQAITIQITLSGPSATEAEALVRAYTQRCLIYTTLERAVPIQIETVVEQLP